MRLADIRINTKQEYYSSFISKYELDFSEINLRDDFEPNYKFLERLFMNVPSFQTCEINVFGMETYIETKGQKQCDIRFSFVNNSDFEKFYTLFSYCELNAFELKGFEILPELNGKKFDDLDFAQKRRLKEKLINVFYFDKLPSMTKEDIEVLKRFLS